jgi:hypothetical protein
MATAITHVTQATRPQTPTMEQSHPGNSKYIPSIQQQPASRIPLVSIKHAPNMRKAPTPGSGCQLQHDQRPVQLHMTTHMAIWVLWPVSCACVHQGCHQPRGKPITEQRLLITALPKGQCSCNMHSGADGNMSLLPVGYAWCLPNSARPDCRHSTKDASCTQNNTSTSCQTKVAARAYTY